MPLTSRRITGALLLPVQLRWRMARAEIYYRRAVEGLTHNQDRRAGLLATHRALDIWRALYERGAVATCESPWPVAHYLKKAADWLLEDSAADVALAGRNRSDTLLSDLRHIHAGMEASIAGLVDVAPGDCVVLVGGFDGDAVRLPWRVVERNDSRVLLRRYNESLYLNLVLARVWRLADGVVELPPVWKALGDWSSIFVGPWLRYGAGEPLSVAEMSPGDLPGGTLSMTLSQFFQRPLHGWVDWTIAIGGDEIVIQLSQVYPPFQNIWLWCMHIAAGCLPCTLTIDTEGVEVHLCARHLPVMGENIEVSIRQDRCTEVRWLACVPRGKWLAAIGKSFGDFFAADFIPVLWDCNADDQDEPGHDSDRPDSLPWCLPSALSDGVPVLPLDFERSLLWLRLAWWSHGSRAGWDHTNMRALGSHVAFCQTNALTWTLLAWSAAAGTLPMALNRSYFLHTRELLPPALCQAFADGELAIERFRAECKADYSRCTHRYPDVTRMQSACLNVLVQVTRGVMEKFPVEMAGIGLQNPAGDWAEILRVDGMGLTLDWGERGIERVLVANSWLMIRRLPAGLPSWSESDLHRRWRRFTTDSATAAFHVCPCCGYPSHELDPDEFAYVSCRFCGWEPWQMGALPPLDLPLELGDRWYTLRRARLNFGAHGDAFAPEDVSDAARVQRLSEVVEAKRIALQDLNEWLETGRPVAGPRWTAVGFLDGVVRQAIQRIDEAKDDL